MRDRDVPISDVKAASQRLVSAPPEVPDDASEITVSQVCEAYLAKVQDSGAKATFDVRYRTIFDFCRGLPSRFMPRDEKAPPTPSKRDFIHAGYGDMPVSALKPIHIDKWLQAHPNWKGARRTKIQAIKRALNYGVESGIIPVNPIKGYKTPKQNARVTYITPEQEKALCKEANPALATAIKVCIRTGARPGCEFAALTAQHVRDHGDRMEWIFRPEESKTGQLRIIRITDPEIIGIVREQIAKYPTGQIFRTVSDRPWRRQNLTEKFRYAKNRLIKKGIRFDDDACMYSCRHTYAKRVLQGFWTGKPTNVETLAKLMGNSPQVCHDHYVQWCDSYTEPLWQNA
jgi:integrase